ncbi:FG-GAP repeat domain-containing protein [Ruegeria meonggei]|uniref:FG-GAP repeat domain-containing protein n=1 Tax=Ruegeria meonggei TaxID=1446476 RepID=UPI00366E6E83
MHSKAPRPPACHWRPRARGAWLALCFWLTGTFSAVAADAIVSARFTHATTRYAHGVLGDKVEYGALELTLRNRVLVLQLPSDRVFEDLAPRLVDVDLDGKLEAIVVETHIAAGAQLAIYDASGTKIAATPHIGTRFRWLAPVGAADLDGDGYVEIAYVDRPHLAKTLRIWRFTRGKFTEIADLPGLTNHKIGEDFISGGLRDCGNGPELIVANADWSEIVSVSYDQEWQRHRLGPFSQSNLDRAMACQTL